VLRSKDAYGSGTLNPLCVNNASEPCTHANELNVLTSCGGIILADDGENGSDMVGIGSTLDTRGLYLWRTAGLNFCCASGYGQKERLDGQATYIKKHRWE